MTLVPSCIADLRPCPSGELLDTLRAAKMQGAGLFLVTPSQIPYLDDLGALAGAPILLEVDGIDLPADLPADFNRFLVPFREFPSFCRWAGQRLGWQEAVIMVSPEDEDDLECCLVPHLENIPGLVPVLAPAPDTAPRMLDAARRLLERTEHPVSLIPPPEMDHELAVLLFSSLFETGRAHSFLFPSPSGTAVSAECGKSLLNALELRRFGLNYVSCPTCGRCEIPLEEITAEVREKTTHIETPLNVAIMGCVVNGPGESKHADIGIAGGRSGGVLIKDGQVVGKLEKHEFVDRLVSEIRDMASQRGEAL